jgi:hypothetical protein
MAVDRFSEQYGSPGLMTPPRRLAIVTPDDDADLDFLSRCVMVGTAGTLAVMDAEGNAVTTPTLTAGIWHSMRLARIKETGTTAVTIMIGD